MSADISQIVARINTEHSAGVPALAPVVARTDLDRRNLEQISHAIQVAAVPNQRAMLHALEKIIQGEVTPLLDRLVCHSIDAAFRAESDQQKRRDTVHALTTKYARRYGDIPAVSLFRGSLEMRRKRRREAFEHFARGAKDAGANGLPRMYMGAYSVKLSDWTGGKKVPGTSDIVWHRKPKERGRLCVLVAADTVYFQRFAKSLHASLREYDLESNVHFHVVNWDTACHNAIADLEDSRMSISAESYAHRLDFTYFATARFYRAREVMRELNLPLYITDIDNRFHGSLDAIQARLAPFDVGFRQHSSGSWFPWWSPSGGNLFLNANDAGVEVAAWLQSYIAARFNVDSRFSWWFDQLALNEVQFRAEQANLKSVNLSEATLSDVCTARPYHEVAALKQKVFEPAMSKNPARKSAGVVGSLKGWLGIK